MVLNYEYFSSLGMKLDAGLSDQEVANIEEALSFRFPPDLRELLQFGLPVGRGFVNWRDGSLDDIRHVLGAPFDGICFDIEFNSFWLGEWGVKPDAVVEAFAIAKQFIDKAPTLIPIYGHRYIPDSPSEPGNPVFSVVQTDIIIYGNDLETYLGIEFAKSVEWVPKLPDSDSRWIEFWTDLVELNNKGAMAVFDAEIDL
jgi:hypothetical protein